jgi:hypothetical protein
VFENPSNGYQESVSKLSMLWTLLFGFIYFSVKGVWTHAIAYVALMLLLGSWTLGIGAVLVWIVYAPFAPAILEKNYLRKGWRKVS